MVLVGVGIRVEGLGIRVQGLGTSLKLLRTGFSAFAEFQLGSGFFVRNAAFSGFVLPSAASAQKVMKPR